MFSNEILNILFNSIAAIVVTVLFLIYLDRNEKRTTTLISNHLQHSTDALTLMAQSISKLSECISGLKKLLIVDFRSGRKIKES
jgi:hypothetical protein